MADPASGPTEDPIEQQDRIARKAVFVAGAGRSGTSTMAGILRLLGLHVPQPEVAADDSNPRGFAEPAWAVEYHDRLLDEVAVTVSDSRPAAWFETGRVATREPERIQVAEWLEEHFAVAPELVVKDPRLGWFLGLWRIAAIRCDGDPELRRRCSAPRRRWSAASSSTTAIDWGRRTSRHLG